MTSKDRIPDELRDELRKAISEAKDGFVSAVRRSTSSFEMEEMLRERVGRALGLAWDALELLEAKSKETEDAERWRALSAAVRPLFGP